MTDTDTMALAEDDLRQALNAAASLAPTALPSGALHRRIRRERHQRLVGTFGAVALLAGGASAGVAVTQGSSAAPARVATAPGRTHSTRPVVLPDVTLRCVAGTGTLTGPSRCPSGPGGSVRLRGLTGMPTLVNIWASWCGPCTAELPAVERLAHNTQGRLRVLGVANEDKRSDLLKAVHRYRLTYPSLDDSDGSLVHGLGLAGIPATLLLSPAGKVVTVYNGPPLDDAALDKLVRRLGLRT